MPHLGNTVTAIHAVWQLVQSGVSPEEIPKRVERHRATVCRWISGIRRHGINGFVRRLREAKRGRRRRKTESAAKARVYAVREKYRLRSKWKKNMAPRERAQGHEAA